MPNLRIITLFQPHATLMVLGFKRNETRSWAHHGVKGTIGIAAAARSPREYLDLVTQWPFCEDLKGIPLVNGAILGTVDVRSYLRSATWVDQHSNPNMTEEQIRAAEREYRYGNYAPGRWIWQTDNAVRFAEPIPAKGKQGWWRYDLPLTPSLVSIPAVQTNLFL